MALPGPGTCRTAELQAPQAAGRLPTLTSSEEHTGLEEEGMGSGLVDRNRGPVQSQSAARIDSGNVPSVEAARTKVTDSSQAVSPSKSLASSNMHFAMINSQRSSID